MNVYPYNKAKEINNFLPEPKKSEQSWTMYSRTWYRHHIWHCAPYCHASHHQPSQELLPLPLTSASCFLDISSSEDRSLGITFPAKYKIYIHPVNNIDAHYMGTRKTSHIIQH